MTSDEVKRLYGEAVQRHADGDYAGALKLLESIEADESGKHDMTYPRALCLVAMGRVEEATLCYRVLKDRLKPDALQQLEDAIAKAREMLRSGEEESGEAQHDGASLVQETTDKSAAAASVDKDAKPEEQQSTADALAGNAVLLTPHKNTDASSEEDRESASTLEADGDAARQHADKEQIELSASPEETGDAPAIQKQVQPDAEDVSSAQEEEGEAASEPQEEENIFEVQSVYPVSADECSVVGRVTKGVFHVNAIAQLTGTSGVQISAPISRIGSADTPLLLAREGRRTVLVLRIEPDQISAGTLISCEPRKAKSDTVAIPLPGKTTILERPVQLAPVERLMKQGDYEKAETLLEVYIARHPDDIVAQRMLAQLYLDSDPIQRDPEKALKLIRGVYRAGGAEDPAVTNILARAQAETGDPEMGLRFMERLYAATQDVEAKQAVAQRIHEFRRKYELGDLWEFMDSHGDVAFEASESQEIIRALKSGAIPPDAECRRNRVGGFEPMESALAPAFPEVAAFFKKQQSQWNPGFLVLILLLLIGILIALFFPELLRQL